MKKLFCLAFALLLLLCGCGGGPDMGDEFTGSVNTLKDVVLEVAVNTEEGNFSPKLINDSDSVLYDAPQYGWSIQIEWNGKWYPMEPTVDPDQLPVSYPAMIKFYSPNTVSDLYTNPVNYELKYGPLSKGHYRIVKDVWTKDNFEENCRYTLAAEFYVE